MESAIANGFYLLIACAFGLSFLALMFFYVRNIGQISKLSWVVVRQEKELVQLRKQLEFMTNLDPEVIRFAAMLQACLPSDAEASYWLYPWMDKEPTEFGPGMVEEAKYMATCMQDAHYEGLWYHAVLLGSILFQLFTIGWHKDPKSNQLTPDGVLVDLSQFKRMQ